ncbi:hypothetical protein DPMN_049984 [Dreissena polymorpha]|uniref:Uncharacterized protein n=1 Tax=Dreissena polymorpha TaxID=45954 RepID=A0A9D4CFA4_DREPO|nr:hypothetical protein DPMN_049984 [Dreissena polymorpha]
MPSSQRVFILWIATKSRVICCSLEKPFISNTTDESHQSIVLVQQANQSTVTVQQSSTSDTSKARNAFQLFEDSLCTPVRIKYKRRLEESYDIQDESSCYDVYAKIHA